MSWPEPSERVRELISRCAQAALNAAPEWITDMDNATLSAVNMRAFADDPELRATVSRLNRANLLHWVTANIRDPGMPVSPNLDPEPLRIARDLVRRGLNESTLDAYRMGQNTAWRKWMALAFEATSDHEELCELLDVSARSVFGFLDTTIAAVWAQMRLEREELTRGNHAERRETVALILDGAPITRQRAEARLGYHLDQHHTAAVVWNPDPTADPGDLERAAEALARTAGASRPLTVIASAATLWVWIPGPHAPDPSRLQAAMETIPAVRVAIGPLGQGLDGFRRSHLDALTTQRMVARLHSAQRVVSFEAVQMVSLLTQDADHADEFVRNTLGDLAFADPDLRASVLVFIQERCNAARAAARLYTHRNTLLRRLARAQELLPRPLDDNVVSVAVALEVLNWRGAGV
ncbi:PucR family transcriptional regulator [Nocardia sp. NPDC050713]|uniref:PucR family transcriptional regulator n=1 Tax=Nocardia sp. NPDC050713 TaxID=3154511 RepID=UPI003411B1E0